MTTCPKCRARYADDIDVCEVDGERLLPDEACANLDADLQEGELVGEYRVERKIGEGAFGTVYGAVHPVIGKAAAIKVLRRQYSSNPTVLSRFVAEARAVNKIRHRNIIDIFSFGTLEGGLQYFVMEWLDGVTLQEQLAQHGPLPPASAIPLLREIARALSAAHNAGIAHRDLKPDNVFLCFDDEDTVYPKLLDFGIAKLLGDAAVQHKTGTGVAMGTPLYMSPEQCRGQGIDHRADIYSFGAMTHEVLTGRPPFDADNVMDLMMKQTTAAAPPMSTVRADLPKDLDGPVLHMLEKEPAERPQTLREAIDELTAAAQAAGVECSGPPSAANAVVGEVSRSAPPFELAQTAPSHPGASGADLSPGATLSNVEADVRVTGRPVAQRRARVIGVIAVVAALLVGVALMVTLTESRPSVESNPTASSEPATTPAATSNEAATTTAADAAAAAPSDEVELTIKCDVADVEVRLGGKKIGTAPGPIPLPRGTEPLELELVKSSYLPKTLTVTPDRDEIEESVELTRRATAPGTRPPTTRPPTSGDPADLATPFGKLP